MKTVVMTIMAALAMYFAISIAPSDALAFTATISSPDAITFVTVVGTVISQEPLIYRSGISPLLKEKLGFELGKSTLAKLFSPAVGQGCAPACYWNKRPLYRPADVLAWAKARLRPGPGMMPMSAEEQQTVSDANEHHAAGRQESAVREHTAAPAVPAE
jgi:hypothetical protein